MAHGAICYLCHEPIDFMSMEVDHILPERLLESADELAELRKAFALESTFDINSFENWLPSCWRCNRQKAGRTFAAVPIFAIQLDRARTKAPEAKKIAQKVVSDRQLGNALATITLAVEAGDLSAQRLAPVAEMYLSAHPEAVRQMLDERDRRAGLVTEYTMGFQSMPQPYLELRLTPFAKILYTSGRINIVSTPLGVGFQPTNQFPDASFYCGHCGSLGPWNGARCLSCGYLSEND
jgi:hypothetical protein